MRGFALNAFCRNKEDLRLNNFIQVTHCDTFPDEILFEVFISETMIPLRVKKAASQIDGPEYDPHGFCLLVSYDKQTQEFALVIQKESGNVCYVDRNGEKHWVLVPFDSSFLEQLFKECWSYKKEHRKEYA